MNGTAKAIVKQINFNMIYLEVVFGNVALEFVRKRFLLHGTGHVPGHGAAADDGAEAVSRGRLPHVCQVGRGAALHAELERAHHRRLVLLVDALLFQRRVFQFALPLVELLRDNNVHLIAVHSFSPIYRANLDDFLRVLFRFLFHGLGFLFVRGIDLRGHAVQVPQDLLFAVHSGQFLRRSFVDVHRVNVDSEIYQKCYDRLVALRCRQMQSCVSEIIGFIWIATTTLVTKKKLSPSVIFYFLTTNFGLLRPSSRRFI